MPHRRRTHLSLTPIEKSYLDNLRRLNTVGRPSNLTGGDFELSAFGKKFVGLGLLLLAWRCTPVVGARGGAWLFPGVCYFLGLLGIMKGIFESDWKLSPFAGRGLIVGLVGFIAMWFWVVAWIAIIAVFTWYGSPHLRMSNTHSSIKWKCTYLGLNGAQTLHYGPEGCPLVAIIPLRLGLLVY